MMLPITSLVAAALALLMLPLSWLVSLRRVGLGKEMGDLFGAAFGDADDDGLCRRIRAFGNFTEYAPLCLVLLACAEVQGAPSGLIGALGAGLVLGRTIHALAMIWGQGPAGRGVGMMLTYPAFVVPAVWLLSRAFSAA